MYSLSLSQQYPITIRLSINIAVMPNLRMSIQRSSAGKHRRHLCIHNGAANVIMFILLTITYYFLRTISFLITLTIPKTKSVSGSQSKRHKDRMEKITISGLSKTTNEKVVDKNAPIVDTITAHSIFSFFGMHLISLVGYVRPGLYISPCISSLSLSLGLQSRHHRPMSKLTNRGIEQKSTDEKDVTIILVFIIT